MADQKIARLETCESIEFPLGLLAAQQKVWHIQLMDTKALEENAEDAAQFLKMLASAPRLLLMCHMSEDECSVGDLAEKTGMRLPTVSQQLSLLRSQGLVATRRDGTTIYYRLASDPTREIMAVLYKNFCAGDVLPHMLAETGDHAADAK